MNKLSQQKVEDVQLEITINHPPNFRVRYGYGQPMAKHILARFQEKEKEQFEFVETMAGLKKQLSSIPLDVARDKTTPSWNQPWFPVLDGMSMFSMIASKRPRKYVEIGSGNSTKFAAYAMKINSLAGCEIISVDPHPRAEIDRLCTRLIRQTLEENVELDEVIESLQPNDIVFFDGSHRCLQNSDVTVFFIDILPTIPDGVIVGIHDIFWPCDYPEEFIDRYYNEQYVLGAYILGMGSNFPLIFSSKYMSITFPAEIANCLDANLIQGLANIGKGIGGGALWFRKLTL